MRYTSTRRQHARPPPMPIAGHKAQKKGRISVRRTWPNVWAAPWPGRARSGLWVPVATCQAAHRVRHARRRRQLRKNARPHVARATHIGQLLLQPLLRCTTPPRQTASSETTETRERTHLRSLCWATRAARLIKLLRLEQKQAPGHTEPSAATSLLQYITDRRVCSPTAGWTCRRIPTRRCRCRCAASARLPCARRAS